MKENEEHNKEKQTKKRSKSRFVHIAITSGFLLTSVAVPVAIASISSSQTASAAVLDVELLSNVTSSNNSKTTTTKRWGPNRKNQPVNFTISGEQLVNATVLNGKKQAVLVIPSALRGNVAPKGKATITTNVTLDLNKISLLTDVFNAANSLTEVITQITSGVLGDLTGVDINLTEVTEKLNLLNNLQNLGGATFTADQTLSADGSYISADVGDGLGLVLAQNVSTILSDLQSAVSSLEAKGSGVASDIVAAAINAALLPVKGTVASVITAAKPLLNAGGSLVNQLLDASALGSTTITMPTTVSAPDNLTGNLDAKFAGTVVQTDAIDVNLLGTSNGVSTIYYGPEDTAPATIVPPTVDSVTGNTTDGYEVKGKADPNTTIDIRNQDGDTIATGTTDANGDFTVTIDPGKASANETVDVVAKDGEGNESQPTPATMPADSETSTVTPPTVNDITGNPDDGYDVNGKADPGTTIEIHDQDGNTIATGDTDENGDFTVIIDPGKVNPGDVIDVISVDPDGNESEPTEVTVPEEGPETSAVTPPTIDGITGNTTKGYDVNGKADPNATIEIRDKDGNVIATGTADANGDFTVTIDPGKASANETLDVVAKDAEGNESTPTEVTTPADAASKGLNPPTIDSVTGNTTDGYDIKGKADPNASVEIRDEGNNRIDMGEADANGDFVIHVDPSKVTPGEVVDVVTVDADGQTSTPVEVTIPEDPTEPTDPGDDNGGGTTDPTDPDPDPDPTDPGNGGNTPVTPDPGSNNGTGANSGSGNGSGLASLDPLNANKNNNSGNSNNGLRTSGLSFGRANCGSKLGYIDPSSSSKSLPRTGEKSSFINVLFGAALALMASVGFLNSRREEE